MPHREIAAAHPSRSRSTFGRPSAGRAGMPGRRGSAGSAGTRCRRRPPRSPPRSPPRPPPPGPPVRGSRPAGRSMASAAAESTRESAVALGRRRGCDSSARAHAAASERGRSGRRSPSERGGCLCAPAARPECGHGTDSHRSGPRRPSRRRPTRRSPGSVAHPGRSRAPCTRACRACGRRPSRRARRARRCRSRGRARCRRGRAGRSRASRRGAPRRARAHAPDRSTRRRRRAGAPHRRAAPGAARRRGPCPRRYRMRCRRTGVLVDAAQAHDVRVPELARDGRLAPRALPQRRVVRDRLERHDLLAHEIERAEHRPGPAHAEDAVDPEAVADHPRGEQRGALSDERVPASGNRSRTGSAWEIGW